MGFHCLKATEPLQRDSLLFNTRSPGLSGTHLVDLRTDLEPPNGFKPGIPGESSTLTTRPLLVYTYQSPFYI